MPIQTNEEFQKMLSVARSLLQEQITKSPGFPPFLNIACQLEAIAKFTENGRIPSKEERESIDFGLVVTRELETDPDPSMPELCERLHELSYYFGNMLNYV